MKALQVLVAMLACAHMALAAGAAASPERGGSKGPEAAAAPHGGAVMSPRAAPFAHSNADRLHSLLSTKARGQIARQPTRVGSPKVATGAIARGSTIGGPRTPQYGRLGGQAIGRTVRNATIDGNQLRRKF